VTALRSTTAPMPIAVFAAAGPCVVCAHEAYATAVFPDHREIHHADRSVRPCPVNNPKEDR
jgi:hypothetical protein